MARSDPLIAIGDYIFYSTQPSFNTLRSTIEPRWVEQERISRAPAGQFIGPANATVDLTGILYPNAPIFQQRDGNDPRQFIDRMSASANAGTVFPVLGSGSGRPLAFYAGLFYIRGIQNERAFFGPDGPNKIMFQITIRAYGDDYVASNLAGKLFDYNDRQIG